MTGAAADRLMDAAVRTLDRAAEAAGARTPEALEERIAALQAELRETKRRLREGGAAAKPKPGDLAARAEDLGDGTTFIGAALTSTRSTRSRGSRRTCVARCRRA